MKRVLAFLMCIIFSSVSISIAEDSQPIADFDFEIDGFTVTFDASSSHGNITDYIWNFGDGEVGNGKIVSHEYKNESVYIVWLTVFDENGKSSSVYKAVDLVPPYTICETIPLVNGRNGWYTSKVAVKLIARDNFSIVNATYYRIDDFPEEKYEGIFYINGEGIYNITFYSIDALSNREKDKKREIKIDKTAPITSCNIGEEETNGWYKEDVHVILNATDYISGVNATYYKIDGGAFCVYNGSLTIKEGGHMLKYFSVDNAGNTEVFHTLEINVDSTPPHLTISSPENFLYIFGRKIIAMENAIIIGNITIEADCTDNLAGVVKLELYIDGDYRGNATSPPYSWLWDEPSFGKYEIKLVAYDSAGNIATEKRDVFIINLQWMSSHSATVNSL